MSNLLVTLPFLLVYAMFPRYIQIICGSVNLLDQSILCRYRDQISEIPRYLKIWCLAISTDDDISDSVTNNETKNDSITFKFFTASGNVGQLLYSRNVSETTEFFSYASQNSTFPT